MKNQKIVFLAQQAQAQLPQRLSPQQKFTDQKVERDSGLSENKKYQLKKKTPQFDSQVQNLVNGSRLSDQKKIDFQIQGEKMIQTQKQNVQKQMEQKQSQQHPIVQQNTIPQINLMQSNQYDFQNRDLLIIAGEKNIMKSNRSEEDFEQQGKKYFQVEIQNKAVITAGTQTNINPNTEINNNNNRISRHIESASDYSSRQVHSPLFQPSGFRVGENTYSPITAEMKNLQLNNINQNMKNQQKNDAFNIKKLLPEKQFSFQKSNQKHQYKNNQINLDENNEKIFTFDSQEKLDNDSLSIKQEDSIQSLKKIKNNITDEKKQQSLNSAQKHQKNQELLKEGQFNKNRGKTSGMSHQQNERSIKEKLQVKQKKGSSMEIIQNETNQDQINDSKRLSLLNSTTNQFDQSNKSSFTAKNIGQIKVQKKNSNIKNKNNDQTLEDNNSTEKQNYHSFAMIEIANTKDMINNQTINMIFQKQSPKLSPFDQTQKNNNPLIIVSKDTDSECFSEQMNQIDEDHTQIQFAVFNYSQAFKAMENFKQVTSYNQFLINKLKKQARKELIKNSNKILTKKDLMDLKEKLTNQKLKQLNNKKKENNSFGKLSNQSLSQSDSNDSIAQIQLEFEERQRIQQEKDRLVVEQRTKAKQKILKKQLQQTIEQNSPRNKNKFDKRVRYGIVLKNSNNIQDQQSYPDQTKQNFNTNYIKLKEKMGSSLKYGKNEKDYDVQTNRLNEVFETKSHDEKDFKMLSNDDINKNKTQNEIQDQFKKIISDEQLKVSKNYNHEEPLNYQFIQIKKIEMPFMTQQKQKIEMQIGPINQHEQARKIKLDVKQETRNRNNAVNHHESQQNSQYFKEQAAFNSTRFIARKINQRISQPPSMGGKGHLINIDEVCGSFDTEKVQKSILNQSNSLKNDSVSQPRNFQINIQADGKISPKLGQIISIIQQESRQNLLNNSIVQESDQKLTSNYKQRDYDSLVSLSREQNLNKINSSQIIHQILNSEKKNVKDGENTVETEHNQLLFQQNKLHQDQEHQEQLFRNIQLMQQSLKEKEEKRIKKKKLLNQDIPLQHKESSGSNKIKSNILQIYLQNSQKKILTNRSTPRDNNLDARPSSSVSEKELERLQAIQYKHYQEVKNIKQGKQNFKELDISDKLQIQKNLHEVQQKMNSKNMNSHYRRQKMPFSHYRHPAQNSLLVKPKMIEMHPNLSLQGHAAQIESHTPTGIKSKGFKLSQGSRNSNKQKDSDISQQIEIIMKIEKEKQMNQQNIMPAPVQNNLQDSFQNRMIKNKIIENVQMPIPGDYGSYNSLENLHRSIILSQESNKTLRQELVISNSPRHSTIKSFGKLSNKSKITEKMFIINEIKDIEVQLHNLQKVYDKNKNILRKMKDQKLNKLYTLNTSRRDSVNSNSNLSNENESMKSRYSQSGSPRKKELLEQQIEILKKQEELKQTLIKSQRKNLQIQQRLIQKIDIQKKTILLLEEQLNQQDIQKSMQQSKNHEAQNKNFIDQSKQNLKQIESNIQKMMLNNQYVYNHKNKQKDKKKEQKKIIIQKEEENLLKKISLLQSLYKTLNLVKMNQQREHCIQIEDKPSLNQQISQMSKTQASKFLTRNEKFNSGDVNSQQSQEFESALQIREMMKTNLMRQESTNQQYTGHSQLDKQNLLEKVKTIRSKEGSLKSQIKLNEQEKLYESGEYIANQNSNQIYSTFTNKAKSHIKNVDQQALNPLRNRNYSLNQDLQISSTDQNLVNDSQQINIVQQIHKMQSSNTERIEDETITKEQESLAFLNVNEQKPQQISDQILKTSKGSIFNQSQNENRNLVTKSILKSIKIEKTEKKKEESQKISPVDQSFKSQIKVKKNNAIQQFQSIFEKQTPQEIRQLISNMTLIIEETSQDNILKNKKSYDQIEIIGKHLKIEDKDKINKQMDEKLKIIKQIEKSFINFHFNQNQEQSNQLYEKEDAYEIANKLDQSLERIEKLHEQLEKNEKSFESSHFQPNVILAEQDSRNITTNQDESNQETFTPRSNIKDIFKYSSGRNHSKERISFQLNPKQVQILNNDSKEQVSYQIENTFGNDNKLEEMDIFIDKFMNYYKDMNSIQKLRDIVIQSQKRIDSNQQFALFEQITPRQTILIELYDKILEDLEKLLFLDIQNILETSTHLEEEINIYQKLKKKLPDKKQINLNQNDHLYINQTHITKNSIQQDLYYQLRSKVHKENYIRHVQNKLTDQITNIEKQSKAQRDILIKKGGLFKDDVQSQQNPKVPLIHQLTDQQFMEGNIDEIKNLKHDTQMSIVEKQKLRKEFNEIKYKKLQKKREQYLDENLSSDQSTHQYSQNDQSNEQQIPKIIGDKIKKQRKRNEQISNNNPLILTNESLQNVIVTSETQNYPKERQKENNTQQLMKNGFEMSVQKLAKVNTHDRDSLMSSKNSKVEDKNNNYSQFTPTNQQETSTKVDLENYFISKQWIKQNQNIQGSQTAPGGNREKILSEQQVDNQQLSYKLQDIKSQNVNQNKSNMVSVIENNVFSQRAKSINKKQRQNTGLIQRDDILYKNVLSFNNQQIKKSDFQNNDNNHQLNLIREKLKARTQNLNSTTASQNQQLPIISEDQPSFKIDGLSKNIENDKRSLTNRTFLQNQINQTHKSQLNDKYNAKDQYDRINTAFLSQRKSVNETVQRSENTENILMLKDLKSSFISSKMASGVQKKEFSNTITNFFGYGNQVIKMGATQQQNFENKYFKYLQYEKPILPALNFILKEQIRQNMDNQNTGDDKMNKTENENLHKEQNRVIDSMHDSSQFQYHLLLEKQKQNKTDFKMVEDIKIESETNKNIRRLMNGQSVIREREERDKSLIRNVKTMKQRKSSHQQTTKPFHKQNVLFTDKLSLQALFQQEGKKIINQQVSSQNSKQKHSGDLIQIQGGHQNFNTIQNHQINLRTESIFKMKAKKLKSTEQISQELSNDDQQQAQKNGTENIKIGQMNIENSFDKEKFINTQNQSLISIQRNDDGQEKSLIDRIINSQMDQQLIQKQIFEQKIWNQNERIKFEGIDSDEKFKNLIQPLQFKFFNEIFQNKNSNLVKQPTNNQKLKFSDHLKKFQEIKTGDMVKAKNLI